MFVGSNPIYPCYRNDKRVKKNALKALGENKKMEKEFREIKPNVWEYEKDGDFTEGHLIAVRVGKYGKIYALEHEKKQIIVYGTVVLDDRMSYIKVGEYVKIEFKGTEPSTKGKPTKIFKVYRLED